MTLSRTNVTKQAEELATVLIILGILILIISWIGHKYPIFRLLYGLPIIILFIKNI